MPQPSKIAPAFERHEDIFLARYSRLRGWALQLTEQNRERAEDLLHDAYIQFTFTRPELDRIGNLDGYLYSTLRNLHLSQVRRNLRFERGSPAILDYDSAEMGLRVADPRAQIRLQDELRQVCRYGCLRKQTSKAGSVLILRFMHGYYPREIAQVMRSTREAVEERLRIARSEARQYLQNPKSLRFIRETQAQATTVTPMGFARTADELLKELRQTVFDSCQGSCLKREQLEKLYRGTDGAAIEQATLAHIVSCPLCLDEVNRLLELPTLSERFPTDTIGTDARQKGGGGDDGDEGGAAGSSGGGGASEGELRRCRKRARDVFEHRPAELCICVNGYLMAAQRVGAELNEQTLSINVAEKIDFIEIFSEQGIRLLFVSIEELPHGGAYKRSTLVQLSDDRTLEATLSFSNPWPTLQVVYQDPLLSQERAARLQEAAESRSLHELGPVADSPQENEGRHRKSRPAVRRLLAWLRQWFARPWLLLRPGSVTVVVSLILIAALLLTRLHVEPVSAAELLRRSTVAEETIASNPETILHRTISLEERRVLGGALISRLRIEVWQSAAREVKLRRVFDEQGALIAGEWTRADGRSTLYRRAAEPQARTAPDAAARAVLLTGELWRLDASARGFKALLGPAAGAVAVEERSSTYVLDYRNDSTEGDAGVRLRSATLTLNKGDLHATAQTLTVEREGEAREYRFVEAAYEQSPAGAVSPTLFQPEPELLGTPARARERDGKSREASAASSATTVAAHPSEAVASVELEIEVTYLLNRIKADLGEQVSMTRTTGGTLRVEALVETPGRKEEILRALGPIINNPAVRVEVNTVGEALRRQQQQQQQERQQTGEVATREVEVSDNRIPADPEVRAYFSARLVGGEAIDAEINRYARRVMGRSRQALLVASALKRLVGRFTPEELRALAPEAQAKWRSMIREHAQAYQREVAALRQELRPVFNGPDAAGAAPGGEASLSQTAQRLLQLSYANDEAVRSAFTISADGRAAMPVKTQQFWRSLDAAGKLAAAIEREYGEQGRP
ncbi:MAG TPA: sigma-70 family RNA polymerase sigma factor [Pyrinomonadaceae bacterium]